MEFVWAILTVIGCVVLIFAFLCLAIWLNSISPSTVRREAEFKTKREGKNWCKNNGHERRSPLSNDSYDVYCKICGKKWEYLEEEVK